RAAGGLGRTAAIARRHGRCGGSHAGHQQPGDHQGDKMFHVQPAGEPPSRKARSWSPSRKQAVLCVCAMKGSGTMAPTTAEVPVMLVPTEPTDVACCRSHTVAS